MRAPSGLKVLSTTGNLTVCWTDDDTPDGYYITSHPLIYPTPTSLWINQSSPGSHWVNGSVCVNLGTATPGQTYEVEVVSLRGKDRSKRTRITHTTGKRNSNTFFKGFTMFQVCLKKITIYLLHLFFLHIHKIHRPRFVHKCIKNFI